MSDLLDNQRENGGFLRFDALSIGFWEYWIEHSEPLVPGVAKWSKSVLLWGLQLEVRCFQRHFFQKASQDPYLIPNAFCIQLCYFRPHKSTQLLILPNRTKHGHIHVPWEQKSLSIQLLWLWAFRDINP